MTDTALCYGIPNIRFTRLTGGEINPSSLVGGELVVVFCPADPDAAMADIQEYRKRANAFSESGAWLIGVVDGEQRFSDGLRGKGLSLTKDSKNTGWLAFTGLLPPADRPKRATGGTFYFGRGGCLVRFWPGAGHADDVLKAIGRRL